MNTHDLYEFYDFNIEVVLKSVNNLGFTHSQPFSKHTDIFLAQQKCLWKSPEDEL